MHAVLLVSGGAAVTPFTTPDHAAGSGLAAGNTMTALRRHLLDQGRTVFTAPARLGVGEVHEDTGWQGFADVPLVLPAEMTVNSAGDIDAAGAALARFVAYLVQEHGVDDLDLVVHSMGGLFSRAALRHGLDEGAALPVRRLVTRGTPWTGSLLGDFHAGDLTLADAQQPPTLWPHDGLVQRASALAVDVPADVLASHHDVELADVHSIFIADQFDLPWEKGLTWDPAVFEVVDAALAG